MPEAETSTEIVVAVNRPPATIDLAPVTVDYDLTVEEVVRRLPGSNTAINSKNLFRCHARRVGQESMRLVLAQVTPSSKESLLVSDAADIVSSDQTGLVHEGFLALAALQPYCDELWGQGVKAIIAARESSRWEEPPGESLKFAQTMAVSLSLNPDTRIFWTFSFGHSYLAQGDWFLCRRSSPVG